ncbi:MAG: DUF4388 domain-containing protein [Deltaproteobacteria bacterium]|nr:DUF4388 domain-containing protein [Deltaproteobacteria bacterium]
MRRTEDILLDENFVTREDLVLFIRLKNSELLYKLMGWKEGDFEFEPSEISVNSAYDTPQPTDSVLMDTFRVVDEWPSINNVITSLNMRFELNTQAADFEKIAKENEFTEAERRIYTLLIEDHTYDVQRLIDISRLGEFETCKALYNLVRTGIILTKKPKNPIPFNALKGGPLSKKRVIVPSVVILNVFLGIIALLLVLLLLSSAFSRVRVFMDEGPNMALRVSIYKHLISDISKERIKNSADVFRYSYGTYPQKSDQLVKAGMLDLRDLSYPFKMRYSYKIVNDEILLENPLY